MPIRRSLPAIQDDNPQVSALFKDFASIASTKAGDLRNFTFEVRTDNGAPNVYLRKINGYATVGNDAGAYETLAGGMYDNAGTLEQYVVFNGAANSDIYRNESGTWTAKSRSLTKDVDGYFLQYKTTLYYTNGTDAIQKFDGTTWSSLAAGIPYSGANNVAKYFIEYKNMLILARPSSAKNRLYISPVGSPEAATVTFDFPSEITGLSKLGSFYVVQTQTKTYVMSGNSPETMQRYEKLDNIGCLSNRSIAEVTLTGNTKELWFVANDGSVRAFNGETSRRVGWEYLMQTWENVNLGQISKAAGIFYDGKYLLSVPYGSATYNDKILCCDPRFERWVWWDNFQAQFLSQYISSGDNFLWFGEASPDSRVWRYPSGFTTQKPSAATAINKIYATANIDSGEPFLIKKFKKLYAQLLAIGSVNYLVESNIDETGWQGLRFGTSGSTYINLAGDNPLWGSVVWGAFTWGGSAYAPSPDNRGLIVGKGKIVRYRFSDNQSTGITELYYFQHFFIPIKVK
jgi:hypothetical protein